MISKCFLAGKHVHRQSRNQNRNITHQLGSTADLDPVLPGDQNPVGTRAHESTDVIGGVAMVIASFEIKDDGCPGPNHRLSQRTRISNPKTNRDLPTGQVIRRQLLHRFAVSMNIHSLPGMP